jgi:hypothetical protein
MYACESSIKQILTVNCDMDMYIHGDKLLEVEG